MGRTVREGGGSLVGAGSSRGDDTGAPGKRTAVEAVQRMGGGEPLAPQVRSGVESHTGADLSGARVHQGSEAAGAAAAQGARAFTYGSSIVLGAGERTSDTALMAHEATHVAQQAGRAPEVMRKTPQDQQTPAEREADRIADLVNQGAGRDRTPTDAPAVFPAPAGSTPQQRHQAAAARLALIDSSITAEDASGGDRSTGVTKDDAKPDRQRVRHQLDPALQANAQSTQTASAAAVKPTGAAPPAAQVETAVHAFEVAVRAYMDAYERTYLVSTDGPVNSKWTVEDWRDKLGSGSCDKQIRAWAKQPYIKFVVGALAPHDVFIGIEPHHHNEIAQQNALVAGLITFDLNHKPHPLVSEVENSSGGYRPGPLRNAILIARLQDLGYAPQLSDMHVDHRAHGDYDGSHLAP